MNQPRSNRFLFTIALILLSSLSVLADVDIAPHFGHPYIFANRIVFTSVDGTHLIAIDKQGNLQWELEFPGRIFEQRSADGQFFVQSKRRVYQVDVSNGSKSELFTMPEHEVLIVGFDRHFLAAGDSRFDHKHLRIINPVDFSIAWESSTIEQIVDVTSSTVVAITADRVYEKNNSGYHLENSALRGFDRRTGELRWSLSSSDSDSESDISAKVGKFLAVVQRLRVYHPDEGRERLLILKPDTGEVVLQRDGNFADLWPLDDSLGVFEVSEGGTRAEFYICNLPQCAKQSPVILSAKEILTGRVYKDYIVTAGIYDTACFSRTTGKRLWEKGQLEWSNPFEDKMVITDFSARDQAARIIAIELATGQERVLFERTVTEHDKANFKPW